MADRSKHHHHVITGSGYMNAQIVHQGSRLHSATTPVNAQIGAPLALAPRPAFNEGDPFPIFYFPYSPADPRHGIKDILICLSHDGTGSKTSCLALYINLLIISFPTVKTNIIRLLSELKLVVTEGINIRDWAGEEEGFSDIDFETRNQDLELFSDSIASTLFGMISVFIGKHMTAASYPNWISRRQTAFAQRTGIDAENASYVSLLPTLNMAINLYAAISPRTILRREVFKVIQSVAESRDDSWGQALKVTMVYLYGAEITHFVFIIKYIVVENPILLAWNELSKLTPRLFAAFSKWISMGDNAPYCKLLYKPEEVPEFNRSHLETLASVARAVAQISGKESIRYYKGGNTDTETTAITEHALAIVRAYGGARTHPSDSLAKGLLIADDNAALRALLGEGAQKPKNEEQAGEVGHVGMADRIIAH